MFACPESSVLSPECAPKPNIPHRPTQATQIPGDCGRGLVGLPGVAHRPNAAMLGPRRAGAGALAEKKAKREVRGRPKD